jgi:hypothetical protein
VTLRETLRTWRPVLIVGGVLVAAGLVAIPLGGWDEVELQSAVVPEQPIGQPYAGHRMSTAIDDLYLTDEHPDGFTEPDPGTRFLVVVATLENLTDEPQGALGSKGFYSFTIPGYLELDTVLGAGDNSMRLLRDGTSGSTLSPGVPDTVQFVFVVDAGLFADGDELRIGLTDATPEEADLFDGTRWARPYVAVEVPVVLRDER